MPQSEEVQTTNVSARDFSHLLSLLDDEGAVPNSALEAAAERYKERQTEQNRDENQQSH